MRKSLAAVLLLALAGTAAHAAEEAKKVLDKKSPDYVRCERTAPIGSMIKSVKVCRTNAEWRKINDLTGKEARDLVERNQGLPPGGP